MRVAITGASGTIGRHLLHHLNQKGVELTLVGRSLSRLMCSAPRTSETALRMVEVDISNTGNGLSQCLENVDALVHLAAAPKLEDWNDSDYQAANEATFEAFLNAAVACGVRNVVFASSRAVYHPSINKAPFDESQTCQPVSAYGRSKLRCEEIGHRFEKDESVSVKILRLGQVLGSVPHRSSALGSFLGHARRGEALPVWGSGKGARDFVHIDDAVDAIARALEKPGISGTFNIARGEPVTHRQLAEAVVSCCNGAVELEMLPQHAADESVWHLNWSRARSELGWSPRKDLQEMVADSLRSLNDD